MLNVTVEAGQAELYDADALVVFLAQDPDLSTGIASVLDASLGGALSDIVSNGDFTGKSEQIGVIYPRGVIPARRVLPVGLGQSADLTPEAIRRASAAVVKRAQELGAGQAAVTLPPGDAFLGAHAVVEGAMLGLWTYRGQKTVPDESNKLTSIKVLSPETGLSAVQDGAKSGAAYARAAIVARDLANLPPNICTPAYLAERAIDIAVANGLRAEVLEKGQILALRMCALLGVAQGSRNSPRFIVLQYNAPRATELETVVLVGKGVTFDTGGYSIKSADGMIGMKGDMSGAAAVLGAMQAVAELEIPLHVVGIVPAVENMIDSHAYRPQDVLTASNGKTIEIISTDAEGRLILADALVYASRFHPAAVVDIATLTGSIVTALGNVNGGLFSNDDGLCDAVRAAGNFVQERVWPMPLMPEYRKLIDSDTADMKNSAGAKGGACIAAAFLKEFVDYPRWAHIDMAGQFADIAGNPYINAKGMNGYGARLLTEFVRAWSTRKGAQE